MKPHHSTVSFPLVHLPLRSVVLVLGLIFCQATSGVDVKKTHTELTGLIGPGSYDADTGWMGANAAGIGAHVRLRGGFGGTFSQFKMNGNGHLRFSDTSGTERLSFAATSGSVKMDVGLDTFAKYRITFRGFGLSGEYIDDLPYLPNVDLRLSQEEAISSYLLGSSVTLSDTILNRKIIDVPGAGINVGVFKASVSVDASVDLANRISGLRLSTSAGDFTREGQARTVSLGTNALAVSGITQTCRSDFELHVRPEIGFNVEVGFLDHKISVPTLNVPIPLVSREFSSEGASIAFDAPDEPPPPSDPDEPPPSTGENFTLISTSWDDGGSSQDGDGIVETRERVLLELRLRSSGPASLVVAKIINQTSGVGVIDPDVPFDDFSSGQSKDSAGDLTLLMNFDAERTIGLLVEVSYSRNGVRFKEMIPVTKHVLKQGQNRPEFEVVGVNIDDSDSASNRSNGFIESGEAVDLRPVLKHIGSLATATDVDVWLTSTNPVSQVTVTPNAENNAVRYPDMTAGDEFQPENNDRFDFRVEDRSFSGPVFLDVHIKIDQEPDPYLLTNGLVIDVAPMAWLSVSPRGNNVDDFGIASPGETVTRTFSVQNQGSAATTITNFTYSHTNIQVAEVELPFVLEPGESRQLPVRINTSGLSGVMSNRCVVVQSDANVSKPGDLDTYKVTGLVSETVPVFQLSAAGRSIDSTSVDIGGPWVVWAETREATNAADIFATNLQSGTFLRLTEKEGNQFTPRSDGTFIAWQDDFNRQSGGNESDIIAYDINQGTNIVVSETSMDERLIGVSDGKIAFVRQDFDYPTTDSSGELRLGYNLYIYNPINGETIQVTSYSRPGSGITLETANTRDFDYGGGILTWRESRHEWDATQGKWKESRSNRLVKMRPGVDASPVAATEYDAFVAGPSVGGNRVVWTAEDSNGDEQLFSLLDGTTSQLTSNSKDIDDDFFAVGRDFAAYRLSGGAEILYYDILAAKQLLLNTFTNTLVSVRADENSVAWIMDRPGGGKTLNFAFVNQPDLAIDTTGIQFSEETPEEADLIDVTTTITNLSRSNFVGSIVVELFNGDPASGGTNVAAAQTVSGGIEASSSKLVTFNSVPPGNGGTNIFYVRITPDSVDNPGNNIASSALVVTDTDTEPPLLNLTITEHEGDGDGVVEIGEKAMISWSATDSAGIASLGLVFDGQIVQLGVNATPASLTPSALVGSTTGAVAQTETNQTVIVGSLTKTNYTIVLSATDGDLSPSTVTAPIDLRVATSQPGGTVQLEKATYSVNEESANVVLAVTRTGGSSGAVSVNYSTADGTATGGLDYTGAGGTLNWSSGDTNNQEIVIAILNDSLKESDETFTVNLTDPSADVAVGVNASALVTVKDDESIFVLRTLPPGYVGGTGMTVSLSAMPPMATVAYGIEERPPAGWAVVTTNISDGGVYDALNHKVSWTFLDGNDRVVSYEIVSPSNEVGTVTFDGIGNVNGTDESRIGGDTTLPTGLFHPADVNPMDWRLRLSEVILYATHYLRGDPWSSGPNPIPLGYAIRGLALYKTGEFYRYDPSVATDPAWWVITNATLQVNTIPFAISNSRRPSRVAHGLANTATSQMEITYTVGTPHAVSITVNPSADVVAYGVEDRPPTDWQVDTKSISDGGVYDQINQKVSWTFLDNASRTVSYSVVPPVGSLGEVRFTGLANFNGTTEVAITGVRTASPSPEAMIGVTPTSVVTNVGGSVVFSTALQNATATGYQWRKNSNSIPSARQSTLTLSNLATNDSGAYDVVVTHSGGSITSAPPATLTVDRLSQSITFGALSSKTIGDTVFDLTATASSGLTVSYSSSDTNVAIVSGSTVAIVGIGATTITASQAGNATYLAAVAVPQLLTVNPLVPGIPTPPTNQTACAGSNVTFSVVATGNPTPVLQWRKNGADIANETNATLTINSVQTSHAGDYTVVATNSGGSVTSAPPAILTVFVPPGISTHPSDATVNEGQSTNFTVTATGDNLVYQWFRQGQILANGVQPSGATYSGVTTSNLLVTAVTTNDVGAFHVVVTNSCGTTNTQTAQLRVNGPPSLDGITADPVPSICQGTNVTLNVLVSSGTPTFGYQWRKGGVNLTNGATGNGSTISGATTASLMIDNIQTADNGSYDVVVTNVAGMAVSPTTNISVIIPPSIDSHPQSSTNNPGEPVTFTVQASGTDLNYQWQNGETIIIGATSANYTISNVQSNHAGVYRVIVSNACGSETSSNAVLTVNGPVRFNGPTVTPADPICEGTNVTISIGNISGTSLISYQWYRGSVNTDLSTPVTGANVSGATSAQLEFANILSNQSAGYFVVASNTVGMVTSSVATVTVFVPPTIVTNPLGSTNDPGDAVSFFVNATGSNLSYQWQKDGVDLNGAIATNYAISNVQSNHAGVYRVVITNACGSVTSSDALLSVNGPAAITTPLTNQTICVGSNVMFTVVASGTAPVYQWSFNGTILTNEIDPTLSLSNVQTNQEGTYSVVVSNSAGSDTSSATLTVNYPPAITNQPSSLTVARGQAASFNVGAVGKPTPTYQWRKNGTNIAGATSSTYTIAAAAAVDAGNYDVVISNDCGSTNSVSVTLTVNGPVEVTTQPMSQVAKRGDTLRLTVGTPGGTMPITNQWRKSGVVLSNGTTGNGSTISGATTTTLMISNIQVADAGSYDYVGSNVVGSEDSDDATITVQVPVVITRQPMSQKVLTSNSVTLSVDIDPETTTPVTYRWRKDGMAIAGASGSLNVVQPITYTIDSVTTNTAGAYDVVIGNICGETNSSPAFVMPVDRSVIVGRDQVLLSTNALTSIPPIPVWLVGDGTENRVSFTLSYPPMHLLSLTGPGDVTVHPSGAIQHTLLVDDAAGKVQVDLQLPGTNTFTNGSNGLVTLNFSTKGSAITRSTIVPLVLSGDLASNQVRNVTNGVLASTFVGGGVSIRKPFRTDKPVHELVDQAKGTLEEEVELPAPPVLPAGSFVRVLIHDLGVDTLGNPIRVLNAAGTNAAGIPFVIFPGTVTPGATLNLALEYYVSDRTTVPAPRFEVDVVTESPPIPVGTEVSSLTRTNLPGGIGNFTVEFNTAAGGQYYVQYAADANGPFETSFPAVNGTGSSVQWVDNGPPRTANHPTNVTSRIYKVIRAQ